MAYLVHCLKNLLFSDIPLLYCNINLNLSITCCLFSGDVYLSLGVSISSSFCVCNFSECDFLEDLFETIVILSAILLPIKSLVVSTVF